MNKGSMRDFVTPYDRSLKKRTSFDKYQFIGFIIIVIAIGCSQLWQ